MLQDRRSNRAEVQGRVVGAAGVAGIAGGLGAWLTVRSQLSGEKIVVPAGAAFSPGKPVRGPLTAFAEAAFIKRAARRATGGRAYGELPDGDPVGEMARDAALLRALLFTSTLAFGVAAAGVDLGAVLLVAGPGLASTVPTG